MTHQAQKEIDPRSFSWAKTISQGVRCSRRITQSHSDLPPLFTTKRMVMKDWHERNIFREAFPSLHKMLKTSISFFCTNG